MTTHDELAYSLASETISRIRNADENWNEHFSPRSHVTSSRAWPVPDFVINDPDRDITAAAEFKPPDQTKREYLTGVGQAIAYSLGFDYSILIVPERAGDTYPIAEHIRKVLAQPDFSGAPLYLLKYDPATVSPTDGDFMVLRKPDARTVQPMHRVKAENSFYAKWREQSPEEVLVYIGYIFDEIRRPTLATGTIRDRAFEQVWADLQAGRLHHWGGGTRTARDTPKNKEAWRKNYRNFAAHIGWIEGEGYLTDRGYEALNVGVKYGPFSVPFKDFMASSLLLEGKHLVLHRFIYEFQNQHMFGGATFDKEEGAWLDLVENHLEERGLLKRNPERAAAAVAKSKRAFFKAEKQIWRNLGLIVPHGPQGGRVYHPGKGLLFDWSRITDLVRR